MKERLTHRSGDDALPDLGRTHSPESGRRSEGVAGILSARAWAHDAGTIEGVVAIFRARAWAHDPGTIKGVVAIVPARAWAHDARTACASRLKLRHRDRSDPRGIVREAGPIHD